MDFVKYDMQNTVFLSTFHPLHCLYMVKSHLDGVTFVLGIVDSIPGFASAAVTWCICADLNPIVPIYTSWGLGPILALWLSSSFAEKEQL